MELVVGGCAGSHTGPDRACSGYLLRTATTKVLLDAGNGSTVRIQQHTALRDLDAVVVSHRHLDHVADLVGMTYALRFDPEVTARMPLFAPPGVWELLQLLVDDQLREQWDLQPLLPGETVEVGDLEVAAHHSVHPPPSLSLRVTGDGRTMTYSGDSAGGPDLVAAAAGTDLLLCEATWQGDADDFPAGIHLTARGAAGIAERAGVGRLLLTHVAGSLDPAASVGQAAAATDVPVDAASDGLVVEV